MLSCFKFWVQFSIASNQATWNHEMILSSRSFTLYRSCFWSSEAVVQLYPWFKKIQLKWLDLIRQCFRIRHCRGWIHVFPHLPIFISLEGAQPCPNIQIFFVLHLHALGKRCGLHLQKFQKWPQGCQGSRSVSCEGLKLNVPWMIPAIRNNNWKQVVWLYAKMDENHEAGLSIVISLLASEASASAGAQR